MPSLLINDMTIRVMILGATGVFGSRLVERVAREDGIAMILAARDRQRLEALRDLHCPDAQIRIVDRDATTAADLVDIDLVIDAAGPFQNSHMRVADAAIAAKVHYIDLADGRQFVADINGFDEAAKQTGIGVLSGASSVPALSHAVLDNLTMGWREIETIRIIISPGNRAPRGLSVVKAILSYAGKPVNVFRDGVWTAHPGWGQLHRWHIHGVGTRWASVCDTPDQDLLVERYKPTRAAEFFAGLELSLLHLGLWALSLPVRWGLLRSLAPLAKPMRWLADRFIGFGVDVGAMEVRVTGVDALGVTASRIWTLRAIGNRGPFVPTLPALALIRQFRDGQLPAAGARSAAGALALNDFSADFAALGIEITVL
jgi:hypothetical protein